MISIRQPSYRRYASTISARRAATASLSEAKLYVGFRMPSNTAHSMASASSKVVPRLESSSTYRFIAPISFLSATGGGYGDGHQALLAHALLDGHVLLRGQHPVPFVVP